MTRPPDHRLYVLLDVAVSGADALPALADAVRASATLVQLRDKRGAARATVELARALVARLGPVPLVVNDRADVARAAGAAGVHLGADDLAPADARLVLGPGAIVGVTLKDEADLPALALADYGTVGGVFPTRSKANAGAALGLAGLARLAAAARAARPGVPIGAIAGIGEGEVAGVIGAGADGVAVVGAVARDPDPAAAARRLRAAVDAALAARGAH